MPELSLPADKKKVVAIEFNGSVYTAEYYIGTHSKASITAIYELDDKELNYQEQIDRLIDGLLGFNVTWDATRNGVVIPTTRESLETVDGSFLRAVLYGIVGDCLPKEAGGENSASGTTPVTGDSAPRRAKDKKKPG